MRVSSAVDYFTACMMIGAPGMAVGQCRLLDGVKLESIRSWTSPEAASIQGGVVSEAGKIAVIQSDSTILISGTSGELRSLDLRRFGGGLGAGIQNDSTVVVLTRTGVVAKASFSGVQPLTTEILSQKTALRLQSADQAWMIGGVWYVGVAKSLSQRYEVWRLTKDNLSLVRSLYAPIVKPLVASTARASASRDGAFISVIPGGSTIFLPSGSNIDTDFPLQLDLSTLLSDSLSPRFTPVPIRMTPVSVAGLGMLQVVADLRGMRRVLLSFDLHGTLCSYRILVAPFGFISSSLSGKWVLASSVHDSLRLHHFGVK